ncbi:MAG: hypothetical protein ACRDT1_09700 [Micromonosporaceae bacterium]
MSSAAPVLLMLLAGLLVGGAWSLRQQGASRGAVAVTVVLAVVALAGGIAWLLPGGG